jgi:ACS family hexuronate transporter-like MFS transporter
MASQSGTSDQGSNEPTEIGGASRPAGPRGAFAFAVGRRRWTICFILFLAATINYVDRQVIAVLKPDLAKAQHWSDIDYGNIVTTFQLAYAIGMVSMGWFMDRVGTKVGFAVAAVVWGLAATAHAIAGSARGFAVARFALGVGEGGMFPGGVKVVAQWFPRRERAFAVGLFNSGVNVGALVTPLAVPWIVSEFGMPAAFVATGLLALLWVVLWLAKYRSPEKDPALSVSEKDWIRSDPAPDWPKIPWVRLLPWKQTWAFAIAKFLTDPIWWLYLFWVPSLLSSKHGLGLSKMGPPLVAIYLMSDVGSIFGGWLSSTLLRRGWSVNRARKTAMIVCASLVVPIVFAANAQSTWTAVVLIGLAAAGHLGFTGNLFTLTSDVFPEKTVGSVVGFGGMFGAVGGILLAQTAGRVLQATGSYYTLFVAAPAAYLVAIAVVHGLLPRLEPLPASALTT